MIKTIMVLCTTMSLVGCSKPLSLPETERLFDKCKTQGGTPIANVSRFKDISQEDTRVISVSCEKDGFRFSEF